MPVRDLDPLTGPRCSHVTHTHHRAAQANPHRRIQSLGYLGQCFARRGMNDLAARTLQNAIKEKVGFDEERKELIYALGSVFEKMGRRDEAIEQFKLIYETDIGYKDVAAKVDAYYAGQ